MSLIRSTSNPERLYAWATTGSRSRSIHIIWTIGPETIAITPSRAFCSFMRLYIKEGNPQDTFARYGYRIEQGWLIDNKDWRPIDGPRMSDEQFRKASLRYRLTYRGKPVITVWETTWMYIVTQNQW